MVIYAPGTEETDPKKQNMSLQAIAGAASTAIANVATNTANIAANAAAITALQSGTVTTIAGNSGAFTLNGASGITNTTNDIKLSQASASQFGAVKVDGATITAAAGVISAVASLSKITASLGADVAINNVSNYFDGPSVAQGTTGTWFVSGTVSVLETASASTFYAKLWDGTTVIASGFITTGGANFGGILSLSGALASPAGNLRISVREPNAATGKMVFNSSGNSKDCTITAIRIA